LAIDSSEGIGMETYQPRSWLHHYRHQGSDRDFETFWWHLTINNVVNYVREWGCVFVAALHGHWDDPQ
jgi:hypothetical protein